MGSCKSGLEKFFGLRGFEIYGAVTGHFSPDPRKSRLLHNRRFRHAINNIQRCFNSEDTVKGGVNVYVKF